MRNDIQENFDFSKKHYDKIFKILENNADKLIKVSEASKKQDIKEATDAVFEIDSGKIAIRTRRNKFNDPYTNVTIRTQTKYNMRTEIDKIKDGYGK